MEDNRNIWLRRIASAESCEGWGDVLQEELNDALGAGEIDRHEYHDLLCALSAREAREASEPDA